MAAHPLDREMRLARVRRPEHGDERLGGVARHGDKIGAAAHKNKRNPVPPFVSRSGTVWRRSR
jgi:hypothetical protein